MTKMMTYDPTFLSDEIKEIFFKSKQTNKKRNPRLKTIDLIHILSTFQQERTNYSFLK